MHIPKCPPDTFNSQSVGGEHALQTCGSEGFSNPLLYRGYTGHEHIEEFGLINMNGRVYDPFTAQFLSPDPYIQAPDMTQNLNRYSYCLNNPLKYVDPTGYKWKWSYLIPGIGAVQALADATGASETVKENKEFLIPVYGPAIWAKNNPQKAADGAAFILNPFKGIAMLASGVEAINNGDITHLDPFKPGTKINNSNRLYEGLFAADTDEPGWGWQIVSRLTWQLPQTAIGLSMSNYFNVANDGRAVEFRNGATVLDVRGQLDGNPDFVNGISVGSYITGEDILSRPRLFRHEFGHYLQSRASGPFYLVKYGMPNLLVTSFTNREHWSEGDADARSAAYFGGTYRRRDFRNPTAWEYMFPSFAPIHFLISIW